MANTHTKKVFRVYFTNDGGETYRRIGDALSLDEAIALARRHSRSAVVDVMEVRGKREILHRTFGQ